MATRLVALHLPPTRLPEQLAAVWDAGRAVLPLPWDAPAGVVGTVLEALRPHELLTLGPGGRRVERTLLGDPRTVPDGTALVLTTSGSTGGPKGVLLPHTALRASTAASIERLGARPGDRFVLALPLHHVAGLQVVLRSWACGTEPQLVADPGDPTAIAATDGEHISLVPTQLARLLDAAPTLDPLPPWRSVLVGGAHLDADLDARAREAGIPVVTSYGMTETCGGCVYDGHPLDGVEVALREDRRIRIRGPVLFSGYLDVPGPVSGSGPRTQGAAARAGTPVTRPPLDRDGWFTTSDLGEVRDGRLRVLGRGDDVIISGGENVPAATVATALRTHPGVADAAVVGLPDPRWGERVVAVAVPADPASPPTLEVLRAHVGTTHPAAFAPRQLVLVDALPRDGMGKVTRDALHALIAGTT